MNRMVLFGLLAFSFFIQGCVPKDTGEDDTSSSSSVSEHNAKVEKANRAIRQARAVIAEIAREQDDINNDLKDEERFSAAHFVKINERYQLLNAKYDRLDDIVSKDLLSTLWSLREYALYNQFIDIRKQSMENQNANIKTMERFELVILIFKAKEDAARVARNNPAPVEPVPIVPAPGRRLSPLVSSQEGGYVKGLVKNSVNGQLIVGAKVGFREPSDTTYFYTTKTDSQGAYVSPALRPGKYTIDIEHNGFVTNRRAEVAIERGEVAQETVALSTPIGKDEIRVIMAWTGPKSGAVKDVDSYLYIPGASGPVFYGSGSHSGADLDYDYRHWSGPETITIRSLRAGNYSYFVHNFSSPGDRDALGNSSIRVEIQKGSQIIRSYHVPQGEGGAYEVFRIEDGRIIDVEQFRSNLPQR